MYVGADWEVVGEGVVEVHVGYYVIVKLLDDGYYFWWDVLLL